MPECLYEVGVEKKSFQFILNLKGSAREKKLLKNGSLDLFFFHILSGVQHFCQTRVFIMFRGHWSVSSENHFGPPKKSFKNFQNLALKIDVMLFASIKTSPQK